ncbi:MAG: aminoglycoside phosphotransferase family protein [Anaerolineales bacterium]|jgi:streptomycin 6-kinase
MIQNLPAAFFKNVTQAFPPDGERWLNDLPDLLDEAARRWELKLDLDEIFPLSYNYVCAATRADGTPVILKVGVPNRELTSEINALRLYAGQGACRLLEADAGKGMLLEERALPGTPLATLKDDDQATGIAAEVMLKIQRPVNEPEKFLSLRDWFDKLKELRPRFGGTTGPFPEKNIARVEELTRALFAENRKEVLLHGDFHHDNILLAGRGWLVIDPKGVIGPAEYEVGPFLMNPWGKLPEEASAVRRTRRRIVILSERLGVDRERLQAWAICHSVLSAYWDLAEDGTGGEYSRAWTEIFLEA